MFSFQIFVFPDLLIAISFSQKKLKMNLSVEWLDDFMRRFCLSNKTPGFYQHTRNLIKVKVSSYLVIFTI